MTNLTRRHFLKIAGTSGAGLVLGFELPTRALASTAPPASPAYPAQEGGPTYEPNAYLSIAPDGTVTIQVFRSEMGQGVQTALPMIIAEELEANWEMIRPVQALPRGIYGNQVTSDSRSISLSYDVLRAVGAAARMMLIAAAAQQWGVDPSTCRAENHEVIHDESGRRLGYGALAEAAATMPVPAMDEVELKNPADFKLIGTPMGQIDNPGFVTGTAQFCSDIRIDGMLYAVVARCPVFGGRVASFDATAAEAVEGVRHVFEIDRGIAVVADSTWNALQGRAALDITWDEGENADLSSEGLFEMLGEQARAEIESMDDGTPANVVVDAAYQIPYLAHLPMEPMCCVAHFSNGHLNVWAPTQHRQEALGRAVEASGLDFGEVTLYTTLIGGAFGRRLVADYVVEAVQIALQVDAPITLFWSRADDIRHGYYHPLTYHLKYKKIDPETSAVDSRQRSDRIPTCPWRSVDNFPNALVNETFIDDVAAASGFDIIESRGWSYGDSPRITVMERALELSGWEHPLPSGRARGIAVHSTFGVTHVAQVHEISVAEDGKITIHRIVCVVDCGRVINPDMVKAQIEGGIIFALSAAFGSQVTIENGRVVESNFHDCPILRFDEVPPIEVHIMPSSAPPQGVGEMGVPTTIPALLNAIYNATGKRLRRIPIRPEDLVGA